jgi:hypothetical protein
VQDEVRQTERKSDILMLPGQMIAVSGLLMSAITEVEEIAGKRIEFFDATDHPDPMYRKIRGRCEIQGTPLKIWIKPTLEYDDQEAVVGHELAHLLQALQGWAQTASQYNGVGQPICPQISDLGAQINSLVADVSTDSWVAIRGFKIEESLKHDVVPAALAANLPSIKRDGREAHKWENLYKSMYTLARTINSFKDRTQRVRLDQEIETLRAAVHYAKLKIRFSKYGLFTEIDALWAKELPTARNKGLEITELVERNDYDTKEHAIQAIIGLIKYLRIPPPLLVVKQPISGEIIWPR